LNHAWKKLAAVAVSSVSHGSPALGLGSEPVRVATTHSLDRQM